MKHDGLYLKVKTGAGGWMVIDLVGITETRNDKTMTGISVFDNRNVFLSDVSNPCKLVKYNRKYDNYEIV